MDNINITTTKEYDISLQADDIDYIVLNDGITELQSAIKDIVSEDKLTQGIITAVGDTKYQPIGDYVTNTELNDKGYITAIPNEYVTESELEAKGYITTLKTINGESLIGEGDIVIQDGNDGYTKEEADAKFQPIGEYLTAIPDNYITEEKLNAKGYITAVPDEYVTDSELEAKGYLTEHQSIKTINGESLVGSGNITIEGGSGDMSNYYTKTEIDNLVGNINNELESI